MHYQQLTKLLGYSEFSPEFKNVFQKLNIPKLRPEISIGWRHFRSTEFDMSFTFSRKINFKGDYDIDIKEYSTEYDECFLEEINFGGYGKGIEYPYSLPYDLSFGDNIDIVNQKMPHKKSETGVGSYGTYLIFNFDSYRIITALNKDERLIWLRVRLLETAFIRKRALAKTIRLQNKNLTDKDINKINKLKKQSPLLIWKKRMDKGDDNFNEDNIKETDKFLSVFIDDLIEAIVLKKANAIISATKKLTRNLNKLNEKHQYFIETLEREELVDYIHNAIKLTGFIIDKETDLTEEWREW